MQVKSQAVAAGGKLTLGGGSFFRLLVCPSAVDIVVTKDSAPIATMTGVSAGVAWQARDKDGQIERFSAIEITSASAQTIKIAVGYGELSDDATTGNVAVAHATGLSELPDVVVAAAGTAQLAAANANRRTLIVGSIAANGGNARVGGATVGAARGSEIQPGLSFALDTEGAVHAHNPTAASLTFTLLEITE